MNLNTIQLTCLCGWKGEEVVEVSDYQTLLINEQYTAHMNSPERDTLLE
jgi:hypothetical protein